ncbi:MAG TPA: hypothetical protein VH044_09750, partial [Polyangiaceae bacterium]|nr:hypothetical protein [Polyangiaceae bacterium]
ADSQDPDAAQGMAAPPGRDGGPPFDSSASQPADGSVPEAAAPDGPTSSACTANTDPNASACLVVPAGWSVVAFSASQSMPCPPGFDAGPSGDVVEGPSASGACSCGACSVTTAPTCTSGPIPVSYDYDTTAAAGTCYMTANPSPLSNSPPGACLTDIYQGDYSTYDARYDAPPASGGACAAAGVSNAAGVTYAARDRICTANTPAAAGCTGDMCRPTLSGAYQECIASPGSQACPSGPLSVAHHVGTSGAVTCSDCGCTVTATCAGTMTLYTDAACKKGGTSLATGVCKFVGNAAFKAYTYAGGTAQKVACQAAAPSSGPVVSLVSEATVCCAQ